jgi:hypothetical protein
MYNIDEKGFLLGVVTRSKRVLSRRLYEEGKLKSMIQGQQSRVDNTASLYMR